MKMTSPNWNEVIGVCEKHLLPSVPCPQCIATADSEVEFTVDIADQDVAAAEGMTINDVLPRGFLVETHMVHLI